MLGRLNRQLSLRHQLVPRKEETSNYKERHRRDIINIRRSSRGVFIVLPDLNQNRNTSTNCPKISRILNFTSIRSM